MSNCCDKREEIFRAALELIAEQGFHGAPMAMIAERAGVAAGTIYRYFENKDALIVDLFHEIDDKIGAVIMQDYQQAKPLRERFHHIFTTLARYFVNHPLHFRYIEQFHNSPYGVEFKRDILQRKTGDCHIYRDLLEEGVVQQVIKDLPMPILFALAFGPLKVVVRDHILGFVALNDELIDKLMAACWDGIRR
ncbi:TetR family transcriptional regulator [Geomonas silvestris]|uniref:TetR family transcriptional regulator n=1 Tax=Geomonas silvestris TaxID=2740184 RepID=A0A6V8MFQ1_9BACT|nr:TetR/AcrR family transcriptional regulator [Geomonas silvestris]GFO58772.1 TetR family transcriptional regulator [Geomonas silvestris]